MITLNTIADQVETDLAATLRDHEKHNITVDRNYLWLELAASTHGGRCPDDETQTTGPAWDWIDGGDIRGAHGSGQCGGCGQLGKGWIHTGARRLLAEDDITEAEGADAEDDLLADIEHTVATGVNALREVWKAVTDSLANDLRTRLSDQLDDAVEAIKAAGLDPATITDDEWDDLDFGPRGSETEPGVYLEDVLTAWDFDPRDPDHGDTIAVALGTEAGQ